jgi:hypothetical protein
MKLWNDYQSGDPVIKSYYRINAKDDLPKPDLSNLIWE